MAFVFTFRVCHARDLAWELVNGDDGGGPPVGVYGKVAARNEDGVAHVPFIYLKYTYITTYRAINWMGTQPTRAAWLLLVFVTGTMKNYISTELYL
jgi:hypothetical protein